MVDKTQGKEAKAVIVSYGARVTDMAMNEAELIQFEKAECIDYKGKVQVRILFAVSTAGTSLEILQNKNAAERFNHMLNLWSFESKNGKKRNLK